MSIEIPGLKSPYTPTEYRAIGFLRATYLPSADKFRQGTMLTADGKIFPALLMLKLARRLQKNPDQLGREHIWNVWLRSLPDSPGLTFSAKRIVDEEQSSANYFSLRGQLWDWDEEKAKLVIQIKRNEPAPAWLEHRRLFEKFGELWEPFYLEIQGGLPVKKERGQIWSLKCFLKGETLLLENGRLILDADELKELEENPPELAQKEIKMTEARVEITLKFNTIPEVRTLPKSRVRFYLKATNGVVFTINIKGKAWRKAEASMKKFPAFVAMVGGKLGNPTPKGFEIESAGLQVFDKQPKKPKEPKEKQEAVSRSECLRQR